MCTNINVEYRHNTNKQQHVERLINNNWHFKLNFANSDNELGPKELILRAVQSRVNEDIATIIANSSCYFPMRGIDTNKNPSMEGSNVFMEM